MDTKRSIAQNAQTTQEWFDDPTAVARFERWAEDRGMIPPTPTEDDLGEYWRGYLEAGERPPLGANATIL